MTGDYKHRGMIMAIDPGLNGAYAVINAPSGEFYGCADLPRFVKMINAVEFARIVSSVRPFHAVIERVGAMPKQGISSTFVFGTAYGTCIGVLAGVGAPLSYVTPGKWKAHFRLLGKDKEASRELAVRLYPVASSLLKLKKDHGRAEAILLARYAFDLMCSGGFV